MDDFHGQIEQKLRAEKEAEVIKQRNDSNQAIEDANAKLQADFSIQVQHLKET